MNNNTTTIANEEGNIIVEFYDFDRNLLPKVVATFERLRLKLINEVDPEASYVRYDSIDLNSVETAQYLNEACRILKLSPMSVLGLNHYLDGWEFDPGYGVVFFHSTTYAETFMREMFSHSVLKDYVVIESKDLSDKQTTAPSILVTVSFNYEFRDHSLNRQYADLLRDVLDHNIEL